MWIAKIDNLVANEMYLIVENDFKELYKFRTKYYKHQKWSILIEHVFGSWKNVSPTSPFIFIIWLKNEYYIYNTYRIYKKKNNK